MASVGIFGAAFNPPHIGHLILVQEARWRLGLDRMIVVPTGDPYHKGTSGLPDGEVRLAMARAAFEGQPGVEMSDTEVRREGPSYTSDTLAEIAEREPGTSLRLVLGADAALGIGSWRRPERVFALARLAVAPRGSAQRSAVERAVSEAGGSGRLEFIEMPVIEISSTRIRERIAARAPFRHLVPTAVGEMIDNEGFYGG